MALAGDHPRWFRDRGDGPGWPTPVISGVVIDPSVGISVAAHSSLCSNHICNFGSEERWLVPLARGKKVGAWSLTEPGAGSDAAVTRSTAHKVDDG